MKNCNSTKINKKGDIKNGIDDSILSLMEIAIITMYFDCLRVYISKVDNIYYLLEIHFHDIERDWIVGCEIFSNSNIDELKKFFYKRNSGAIKSLREEIKLKNLELRKIKKFLKDSL